MSERAVVIVLTLVKMVWKSYTESSFVFFNMIQFFNVVMSKGTTFFAFISFIKVTKVS
jgi:hypothetical protein